MAIKVSKTTNPVTSAGGDLLSPSDWISRIGWVVMFGAVFAIGSKVLTAADKFIPGSVTPVQMQNATSAPLVGDNTIIY